MKKLIALAIAFMALLGSPLRAEIVKKVIAPSPTLTKSSLIEAEFGDKYKVVCHSTVHHNIKTLTYVPFGVVLGVDHRRNRVKVIDLYPANTVAELEAKIAARDSKGRKESVASGGRTPSDNTARTRRPPNANPNQTTTSGPKQSTSATAHTADIGKEGLTFVDPEGASRPLTVENVHTVIEAIRGQVKALNDRVVGLQEQNKTLASVTAERDAALQSHVALQKALSDANEKLKSHTQAAEVDLPAEKLITASLTRQLDAMKIENKKVEQRIKMEVDAKGAEVKALYLSYLWWIVPGVLLLVFTAFLIGRYLRPRMFVLPRHLHQYDNTGAKAVTFARLEELLKAQQADLRPPTRPAAVPEPRVVTADPPKDLPLPGTAPKDREMRFPPVAQERKVDPADPDATQVIPGIREAVLRLAKPQSQAQPTSPPPVVREAEPERPVFIKTKTAPPAASAAPEPPVRPPRLFPVQPLTEGGPPRADQLKTIAPPAPVTVVLEVSPKVVNPVRPIPISATTTPDESNAVKPRRRD